MDTKLLDACFSSPLDVAPEAWDLCGDGWLTGKEGLNGVAEAGSVSGLMDARVFGDAVVFVAGAIGACFVELGVIDELVVRIKEV